MEAEDKIDEKLIIEDTQKHVEINTGNDIVDSTYKSSNTRFVISVPPHKRTTSNYMCLTEYTRVVVVRAQQIANGSPINTEAVFYAGENIAVTIAKKEILEKKCPLKIRRVMQVTPEKKVVEDWAVNELIPTKKCYEDLTKLKFAKHEFDSALDVISKLAK